MSDLEMPFNPRRLSLAARAALRDSTGYVVKGEPNMLRGLAKRGITHWNRPGYLTEKGLALAERYRSALPVDERRSVAYVLRDLEEALSLLGKARDRHGLSNRAIGRHPGMGGSANPGRWFRAEVIPQSDTLFRLAGILGYDIALIPKQESVAITTDPV